MNRLVCGLVAAVVLWVGLSELYAGMNHRGPARTTDLRNVDPRTGDAQEIEVTLTERQYRRRSMVYGTMFSGVGVLLLWLSIAGRTSERPIQTD